MKDMDFVTCKDCKNTHDALDVRLKDGEVKFAVIETQLKSIVTLLKITATALCTGIVGIATALLMRGV